MNDNTHFQAIKDSNKLPSPRGAAMRLMELCRQDDVSLIEIVRTLNADPMLTSQVIKIANAPLYGRTRPVVALSPDVIISIGIQTLRQIVLAFSLISAYRQGECQAFDYEAFWSRSAATAVAAESLGELVAAAPQAELFTCGLLSNIGRLTLATVYPGVYSDLLARCSDHADPMLLELERRAFELDHNQLTAAMMQDWGIPKLFSDPVLYHETPEQCEYPAGSRAYRLLYLFHLAAQIAHSCFLDDYGRSTQLPRLFAIAEKLSITPAQLVLLGDKILAQWQEWSHLLHTGVRDLAPFSSLDAATAATVAGAGIVDPAAAAGIRVLLVDDDPAFLLLLQKKLSSLGYAVFCAADGRQGLEQIAAHAPQIIISDAVMPEMSGSELCRAIRQTISGRSIYFIMLTSHTGKDHLVEAFQAGVDDFLGKPVNVRMLLSLVAGGTRIVRLQQQLEAEQRRLQEKSAQDRNGDSATGLADTATGLPNRRYAMQRLEEQWAQTLLNHVPFTCLRVSLDHFDAIRQSLPAEDSVRLLQQFAGMLKATTRVADVLCCLEPGEFLILNPHAVLNTALIHAERLLVRIANNKPEVGNKPFKISASIGAVMKDAHVRNVDHLLHLAEQALAQARQKGGGCVIAAKADPNDTAAVSFQ